MKLTVLADNNTLIDSYYLGEPALSFYIEEEDERILFDTGYSDAFLRNAEAMGIDLSRITAVVLSHGHNDHTRGLTFLWDRFDLRGVKLIAHPGVFDRRQDAGLEVGAPFTLEDCRAHGLVYEDGSQPVKLTERLTFLGAIERTVPFEGKAVGRIWREGKWKQDPVAEDSAMVYAGKEGPFVITGCSHSGICNILLAAKACCKSERINTVIGGFHLMEVNDALFQTIAFLKQHTSGALYACHCVSLYAKHEMMKELPLKEVGVGLRVEAV